MKSLPPCLARGIIQLLLSFAALFPGPGTADAIDIWISGSWNETIDKNDLTAGPGTDLVAACTSSQNVNLITVSGAKNKNDNWQVSVKRIDTTWDNRMQLFVRRTSGGSGTGSASGGEAFIQVSQNDVTFFTGAGNLNNIRVQLQLTDASLQIPMNQYTSTVQYTIIDTP